MSPVAVSKNIFTPFSIYLFSLWEMSCWKHSPCSSERVAMISGKKLCANAGIDTQIWFYVL
jgi:hypothetical protein